MFLITHFCLSNTKQDYSTQDISNAYTDALNLENILQFELKPIANKRNTHNIISLRLEKKKKKKTHTRLDLEESDNSLWLTSINHRVKLKPVIT